MKSMTIQASLAALTLMAAAGAGWADTPQGTTNHAAMQPPAFDQVDSNKDGSITQEEADAARIFQGTGFAAADQNKDGKLNKAEYDAATKAHDRRGG
ncbi:MAG: EF-hand domain-containing protein [Gammaproteobacteria bacterium]|nr:EF-hand domain-containing protein [Gammaproteobacteria bacterium]